MKGKEEENKSIERGGVADPMAVYPKSGYDRMTNVRPTLTRANIEVGEFTYFSDQDFESHVTHHYDFIGDKLVIGKFCQIGAGVNFVMNGANHQMNAATTFPFYVMDGWEQAPPAMSDFRMKGDTVVGNDVWFGENVTVLPGVKIGDGAIIGRNSVVGTDVAPYTIVAGNPARLIRQRFDAELTDLLLRLRWWDKPVDEIQRLIPMLTSGDLDEVKRQIKLLL